MNIIQAVDVRKVYEDNGVPVPALNGVSVTVEEGEFTVIAGPSGSGKTTLLNLLGALDVPTGGAIHFEQENLAGKTRKELSRLRLHRLGFVFQAYNLIPVLSAVENVEFSMVLLGVPAAERRRRAMEVMEELGIAELAHKRPNAMSGGQQQRVAVGRAIVTRPRVVLADEPTANLDSVTGAALLDLMQRLNAERGVTFLFSSHDAQVIERARRLLILRDGRIASEKIAEV